MQNQYLNLDPKVRIRTNKELEIRKDEFIKICNLFNKLNIRYFLQILNINRLIKKNFTEKNK